MRDERDYEDLRRHKPRSRRWHVAEFALAFVIVFGLVGLLFWLQ